MRREKKSCGQSLNYKVFITSKIQKQKLGLLLFVLKIYMMMKIEIKPNKLLKT